MKDLFAMAVWVSLTDRLALDDALKNGEGGEKFSKNNHL
jgi:hypothetical protein